MGSCAVEEPQVLPGAGNERTALGDQPDRLLPKEGSACPGPPYSCCTSLFTSLNHSFDFALAELHAVRYLRFTAKDLSAPMAKNLTEA
jgi:hypothetical protein